MQTKEELKEIRDQKLKEYNEAEQNYKRACHSVSEDLYKGKYIKTDSSDELLDTVSGSYFKIDSIKVRTSNIEISGDRLEIYHNQEYVMLVKNTVEDFFECNINNETGVVENFVIISKEEYDKAYQAAIDFLIKNK